MIIPANRPQAIQDRNIAGGALARPTTGSLDTVVCDCDWHAWSICRRHAPAMPQHVPRHMPQHMLRPCCSIPPIDQPPVAFAPFFRGFVPETLGLSGEARNARRERIQNSLSLVGEDASGGLKTPPAMARLLEIRAAVGALLDIQCEDCGRTRRMWPGAIQEGIGQGTRTLMGPENRLSCSCRERGGLGKTITLVPTARRSA